MGRLASTKSGGLHEAPCRSRRCGIRPVVARDCAGAGAGARDHQDRGRGLSLPQQRPLFGVCRDVGGDHRHRSGQRGSGELAQGRAEEALAGQGDQVRGLQPRSCRPYLRRRGVGRYGDGGGARQGQGGHHRRKAADRGAAGHLQRPRDDRSRRHRPGADLCRPQPFQQLAGDALPQGEDHLRRRLHSGERRGVPRLPRRLSQQVRDPTRCARSRRWSSTSWRRATARSATRPT